jgi:hypothetical protein
MPPPSAVQGTLTLKMNYDAASNSWTVDPDGTTASLEQQTPTRVHDPFGDSFYISLSGTYSLSEWIPDGVASLDTGVPFELLLQKTGADNGIYLIVSGTFQGAQFTGGVINPGQDTLGGEHFPGFNPPNYDYSTGTGYHIGDGNRGVLLLR